MGWMAQAKDGPKLFITGSPAKQQCSRPLLETKGTEEQNLINKVQAKSSNSSKATVQDPAQKKAVGDLAKKKAEIEKLIEKEKPDGSSPGGMRDAECAKLADAKAELEAEAKATLQVLLAADPKPTERMGQKLLSSMTGRGPVLTVLKDLRTGKIYYGQNMRTSPSPTSAALRDRIDARLADTDAWKKFERRYGIPGRHSEVWALHAAILARPVDSKVCSFGEFALYNIRTRDYENAKTGEPIVRCPNCDSITDGVVDLSSC